MKKEKLTDKQKGLKIFMTGAVYSFASCICVFLVIGSIYVSALSFAFAVGNGYTSGNILAIIVFYCILSVMVFSKLYWDTWEAMEKKIKAIK